MLPILEDSANANGNDNTSNGTTIASIFNMIISNFSYLKNNTSHA
jgi:hypothetical protein